MGAGKSAQYSAEFFRCLAKGRLIKIPGLAKKDNAAVGHLTNNEETARRYWARRRSTFPVVGPCMEAINRPYSVNQVTVTPISAQCSSRYWLQDICPKQTMDWSVCKGILPSVFPARRSSTHSPSFESHASCVVTNRVFKWLFMVIPRTNPAHMQMPFSLEVRACTIYSKNKTRTTATSAAAASDLT